MLPKAHRIIRGDDFRRVVRSGKRFNTPYAVVHVAAGRSNMSRFGFIVSKRVGGAVVRNRLKRQLSEMVRRRLPDPEIRDVVIRVHPAAAGADFGTLDAGIMPKVMPW